MAKLDYPVLYKTDETIDQVADRLATQCEGSWSVEVESMDLESNSNHFRVLFERESDIRSLLRPSAAG